MTRCPECRSTWNTQTSIETPGGSGFPFLSYHTSHSCCCFYMKNGHKISVTKVPEREEELPPELPWPLSKSLRQHMYISHVSLLNTMTTSMAQDQHQHVTHSVSLMRTVTRWSTSWSHSWHDSNIKARALGRPFTESSYLPAIAGMDLWVQTRQCRLLKNYSSWPSQSSAPSRWIHLVLC